MESWGQCQCPLTLGMAGHWLITLGGHTCTTMTTCRVADTVFDRFELRRLGGVRWCAHHLQQLEPPWGIGGGQCPHTAGMARHWLITLGGHTCTTM